MDPLFSERLNILCWSKTDLEEAYSLWGDPKVMEFIDTRGGLTKQQVSEKLVREITSQEKHGVQYWKVIEKNTGEFLGCCGLRPATSDESGVYEIGFHIVTKHWGKGYAKEAAQCVIRHAFEVMKLPKLFAGHNPKNTVSKTVLEKLGFRFIGNCFYEPTGLNHPSYELQRQNPGA